MRKYVIIPITYIRERGSSKVQNWAQFRYPIRNQESFNVCLKNIKFKNVVEQDIHESLRLTLSNSPEHRVYCMNACNTE